MDKDKVLKTFLYDFPDKNMHEDYPLLDSIGWEYRTGKAPYYFDCRKDVERKCVFQYTVSGEGMFMLGKKVYKVTPGQAILIEKPGPYIYGLSESSSHWEYKFLTLSLSSFQYWNKIIDVYGHIIDVSKSSRVLSYWNKLYSLTLNNQINNIYDSSAYAYTFIMRLQDSLKKDHEAKESLSGVQKCLDAVHSNYHLPLNLDELSSSAGISSFYLSKLFREATGDSPIQYLIKYRLKMACSLLLRTALDISSISHKCGFENPNYFSRIFKKHMDCTPTEYRENENWKSGTQKMQRAPKHIEIDHCGDN